MSKIFKRVIFEQLTSYFNSNNMFYRSQYGFREKHYTELEALELVDTITQEQPATHRWAYTYMYLMLLIPWTIPYFCTNYM